MAVVVQKSRTSSSSKGTAKSTVKTSSSKTFTKGTSGGSILDDASDLAFTSVQGLTASDVQSALTELGQRFYQLSLQPSVGVNEGDLWYDLTASELKLYNGTAWGPIGAGNLQNLTDTLFKFTATPALTSGNVFEFINGSTSFLSLNYEGVLQFRDHDSTPTATEGGMYFENNDLFIGVNR